MLRNPKPEMSTDQISYPAVACSAGVFRVFTDYRGINSPDTHSLGHIFASPQASSEMALAWSKCARSLATIRLHRRLTWLVCRLYHFTFFHWGKCCSQSSSETWPNLVPRAFLSTIWHLGRGWKLTFLLFRFQIPPLGTRLTGRSVS